MSAEHSAILRFLEELDKQLSSTPPITVYLIGGAAITLAYDHENRTADLDLIDAPQSLEDIAGIDSKLAQKHRVYVSCLDEINFSAPDDWRRYAHSLNLEKKLKHLNIQIPTPEDLCLAKLARLEFKDIEDIQGLWLQKKLSPEKVLSRLNQHTKALREIEYRNNAILLFSEIFQKPIVFARGQVKFKKPVG